MLVLTVTIKFVKCFRDEDLCEDRQPEFTQVDLETLHSLMSKKSKILLKGLIAKVMKETKGNSYTTISRMSYDDAMNNYGSDKPDTRF